MVLYKKQIDHESHCCEQTSKNNILKHTHDNKDSHDHSHDHNGHTLNLFLPSIFSLLFLLIAIIFDYFLIQEWFTGLNRFLWYFIAYSIVGYPVIKDAFLQTLKGNIFSEFLLMTIATIGAFFLKEYPEAVAVMLFYSVGEVFQSMAVSRAKRNIKSLIDQRPEEVTILKNNQPIVVPTHQANIGDIIQLKPGEQLGLDGELLNESAAFNTSALTGESKPDTKHKGETVLAGMINLHVVTQIRVLKAFQDSKLSKILELVQNASAQKAPTELFIRKFAKVYTPIVVVLAIGICLIPALFLENYLFNTWLYRSLVFLVISCPCALVISIPLGYFGGIGAASKNGILIKGSNYIDVLANIQHIVMDKTGTLTKGVFKVQEIKFKEGLEMDFILRLVNAVENQSTHPIATAIKEYVGPVDPSVIVENTEEIPGHGLRAIVQGKELLVGNFKLLDKFGINYTNEQEVGVYTTLATAYHKNYVGYITIADQLKEDAKSTILRLNELQVQTTMLSGDKNEVVSRVAQQLGIKNYFGNLLPEDKVNKIKEFKRENQTVAFVGDGVNDAPVVALSDVGIAMGGLGSDATIESADVVIQDDKPSKIPIAIQISKKTKKIVLQNIALAFGVKAIVLLLGAGGLANMWEAVFADVGVALLAILNALRIQNTNFLKHVEVLKK